MCVLGTDMMSCTMYSSSRFIGNSDSALLLLLYIEWTWKIGILSDPLIFYYDFVILSEISFII
jgi:hypothetical protein